MITFLGKRDKPVLPVFKSQVLMITIYALQGIEKIAA